MRAGRLTSRALFLGGLMLAAACMDVAGPHASGRVALQIVPVFDTRSGGGAGDADSFVIVIQNPPFPDDTIARRIDPGQDTIQIIVQTNVSSSGADTIGIAFDGFCSACQPPLHLYSGTTSITVFGGAPAETAPVPASYVGPGARIRTLTVSPRTVLFAPGSTAQLAVVATDSSDSIMPGDSVPLVFLTRNVNVAAVSRAGILTAVANGQTWVVAQSVAHSNIRDSVEVTVGQSAPPVIALNPSSATFTDTIGGANPPDQVISVTNAGGGSLSGLSLGAINYGPGGSGWLTATLSASTAPSNLTLHVSPTSLAPGHYTATIPITGTAASNAPLTLTVAFDILNGTLINLSATTASFSFTLGGANPGDDTIAITNGGTGTLSGLAVGTMAYGGAGSGWLTATLTGTTAPAKLVLHVSPGTLQPGNYTATFPITATAALNSPQSITVSFAVIPVPLISLAATSVSFTDTIGFANPNDQTVMVTNGGTGTLYGLSVGTPTYGQGSGWLSGIFNASNIAPTPLTVHVNASGLAVGHYTATLPVQSSFATNSPQNLSVSLDVVNPPLGSISITPGWFVMLPTGGQSLVVTAKSTIGTALATPALTWTSRSPSVATVNASGSVTGVAGGTAVIVADAGGGIADSVLVAVAGSGQAVAYAASDTRGFDGVKVGDTVRVTVAVDLRAVAGGNVGSYTAQVNWNTAQLAFVSATPASGSATVNTNNTASGQFTIGDANPNGYTTSPVGIVQLTFVATGVGASPMTLSLSDLTEAGTFTNLLTQAIVASSAVTVH